MRLLIGQCILDKKRKQNMSKIEGYLKSMGSTADEVAQYLRMEGIKGAKGDPCFCPIIKAIYHKFPNLSRGLKVESVSNINSLFYEK